MANKEQEHWLSNYATDYNAWKTLTTADGRTHFQRPLGLVETSFDSDGTYYGGRADMTAIFTLAIQHKLSKEELKRRIVLAWTSLRLQHVLLMSRVADEEGTGKRCFVIDVPSNQEEAIEEVERSIVWMGEKYDEIDEKDLYLHAYNVGRIIEPWECLSKLHVLPIKRHPNGTFELRFLIVIAHQTSDGLSAYAWFSHFTRILNTSSTTIQQNIEQYRTQESIRQILPPAQESLYPRIAGSPARQRWFWALIRILRYIKKPLSPTFTNPLRRPQRLEKPIVFEPKFDKFFNYKPDVAPPMSSAHITASLSPRASSIMLSLCRAAHVSIGAGCFALAGLAMMDIHHTLHPSTPASHVPAFAASFPLNPRAFFANPPKADSCMLAFSDGIVMPFLPSSLPVEGRFKLVAKHANRELRVYQKRKVAGKTGMGGVLDKRSLGRLLATGYVAQIERVEDKLPPERRTASLANPQGALRPLPAEYGATCGVSSVGSTAPYFRRDEYGVEELGERDFAADFRDLQMGVRARENEFLIGSSTNAEGVVSFGVSYDLNAISQEAAEMWKDKIRNLLEPTYGPKI